MTRSFLPDTALPIEWYAFLGALAVVAGMAFGAVGLFLFPIVLVVFAMLLVVTVGRMPVVGTTACYIGMEAASIGIVSSVAIGFLILVAL